MKFFEILISTQRAQRVAKKIFPKSDIRILNNLQKKKKNGLELDGERIKQCIILCKNFALLQCLALCVIFTILVSFSRDDARFASKAKINIFLKKNSNGAAQKKEPAE